MIIFYFESIIISEMGNIMQVILCEKCKCVIQIKSRMSKYQMRKLQVRHSMSWYRVRENHLA
jgi:hypothetical protein